MEGLGPLAAVWWSMIAPFYFLCVLWRCSMFSVRAVSCREEHALSKKEAGTARMELAPPRCCGLAGGRPAPVRLREGRRDRQRWGWLKGDVDPACERREKIPAMPALLRPLSF